MPGKSALEIEVKLRVASRRDAQRRLRAAGARRVRTVREHNILFDAPGGRLRQQGCLLRLRIERARGAGKRRFLLTCKGPVLRPSRYKAREEQEFEVRAAAPVIACLRMLGFAPVFRYEKARTSYAMRGAPGLHVELDQVPFGWFIELEGPRRLIDMASRRLGYRRRDYVTRSYLALHAQDCRRRGAPLRDMLFPRKKSR